MQPSAAPRPDSSHRARPRLLILGTRGIPARHGGFETFAERLALHLVGRGWKVEVFCQDEPGESGPECWRGVRLRRVPVPWFGAKGSILFDWRAMRQARDGLLLTLGYNTALFGVLARLRRLPNLINMDGVEWRRAKWPKPVRAWFWLNEWLGSRLGSHLIADHPAIADHLARPRRFGAAGRERITTIPYGADA
ncbi:MAG TPA: DUF1972 domain-containing protein, partial [Acetobacteraceae bacterium]